MTKEEEKEKKEPVKIKPDYELTNYAYNAEKLILIE